MLSLTPPRHTSTLRSPAGWSRGEADMHGLRRPRSQKAAGRMRNAAALVDVHCFGSPACLTRGQDKRFFHSVA